MTSKKAAKEKDEYTPQERLTAAALEYKKLEGHNQSSIERMYGALSSPFRVSNKPCEVPRAAVLRCFEEILGKTNSGENGSTDNLTETTVVGRSISGGNNADGRVLLSSDSRFPSVHRCYDAVLQYESCVVEKTLAQHHSLLAEFEARQLQEVESTNEVPKAVASGA
ncbi:hypothetical protein C3747_62g197 [Trypanosoma cruzi]|uniref:Uncharacterized protein n=2 Tax=Trypanosoma cruzi TaxID=5693 RepID=Q4CWU4_TRYCC|nr:hypothetical protein, conserved [Trypanosoma cruzi]EAN84748.1 hypothetical protein, conserved [Trypanosoma cruzi]PWV11143.1 hypothetical protein C3747_62g197 [Trypanosoma cruzi]|eukprot:XP_806599.1 hypothetical protein [Trypanosoma cruzi strain CL Brener]